MIELKRESIETKAFALERFMVPKNNGTQESSTCSDGSVKAATTDSTENGNEVQPPKKKPRLSNREYKKLKKGQNKVKFRKLSLLL